MNVILDANIFVQDFLMNSTSFGLLLDYLKKTDSKILMPQIVYLELCEIYRREMNTRLAEYDRARKALERMTVGTQVEPIMPNISNEVEAYQKFIERKLNIGSTDILPFKESHLSELVKRGTERLKPFTEKGEEFRDALLWLSLLDIARETDGETLAFISNDYRAFGQNHELYEALSQEANATGKRINYYNSISKFIESHATKVEYVTAEWLTSVIDFDEFEDLLARKINKRLSQLDRYDLEERGWEGLEFRGYASPTPTGPINEDNLAEYYVYEKSDGSLYIQANYYIEYEMEFSIRESAGKDNIQRHSRPRYIYSDFYEDEDEDEDEIETRTIYKCREIEVIFGVAVKDKEVINIELQNCYF